MVERDAGMPGKDNLDPVGAQLGVSLPGRQPGVVDDQLGLSAGGSPDRPPRDHGSCLRDSCAPLSHPNWGADLLQIAGIDPLRRADFYNFGAQHNRSTEDLQMPAAPRAPATEFVTSADGTAIAYSRMGQGPAIVMVSGMLNDRRKLLGLAEALSADFAVFHFDRRGRGESGDSGAYSIAREIDDIAALIEAAGGSASVYGHSSGAALAAHAASAGLPIRSLVLHEPPYGPDDAESRAGNKAFAISITRLIHAGRHAKP